MVIVLTSLPLGRERFGVAASEELSPTPGRELGLGERDLCDEHDEHDDGEHDEHEKHDELDGDGDGDGGEHYEHFGDGDGYSERTLVSRPGLFASVRESRPVWCSRCRWLRGRVR